jgi:Glyoxalase-like domain
MRLRCQDQVMSTILFNIAFDSRQPQVLGRFWSEALGLTVKFSSDDVVRLAPAADSGAPNVLIMKVDDPTPGKNRVHIDLAANDVLAEVHRLVGLGATLADGTSIDNVPLARTANEIEWFTLRDPDGNEFCIGAHPS